MKHLYERLATSKAERFKFLGDAVRFLETQGCKIDEDTLARACLDSEEQLQGNAKIGLANAGGGRVAGILLI